MKIHKNSTKFEQIVKFSKKITIKTLVFITLTTDRLA